MTEIAQEQEDWASEYPELELTGHEFSEDEPTEDEPTTYEWRGMETWAGRVL